MMMESIKNIFIKSPIGSVQRVDNSHPADLYVGKDDNARWCMLLVSEPYPKGVVSSKMISVSLGQRNDDRYTVTFTLIDSAFCDLFVLFCEDIIASSRQFNSKVKASEFVIKRYLEWREMLANCSNTLLTAAEIKGLLGEMYFLKTYMSEKYGIEKAALSWTGPRKLPQDFIIDSTWYEVKTISSNRDSISISSIEQLDTVNQGTLIVILADKTSSTNLSAENLNHLYSEIVNSISDNDIREGFISLLLKFGYFPRPEYETDDYIFVIAGMHQYSVNASFPCLRRASIPIAVESAEYSLFLKEIKEFMVV